MAPLQWDVSGERLYETGVDRGVLYIPNGGVYDNGYAWNGLTGVTESPSGAEPTPLYADNIKYLNLVSAEEFAGTIEAFTYPDEFGQCDGTDEPEVGVLVSQQRRLPFGLSYRTKVGNDIDADDFAYKLHLVYGALAAPSEKGYVTINDTPEAITFSWEFSTTPVAIGVGDLKPTSLLTINSATVDADSLLVLENALYGASADPRLPLPAEVIGMFAGDVTLVTALEPGFVEATGVITIPTVTGVRYRRADTNALLTNGSTVTIATDGAWLTITAEPTSGAYALNSFSDDDWAFQRNDP